jgi:SsrA-binding protein
MFIDEETKGRCKVLIALARGKREYDKRESIKKEDAKRELQRVVKKY